MPEKRIIKLYDIPRHSKIYEKVSDGSDYFIFHYEDGTFSYCVSEKGEICYLIMTQKLIEYKDGYKFVFYEENNQSANGA